MITGVAVAASIGLSLANLSAPVGLWQSVNLLQMFLLILLLKIDIPIEIRSYITSNGFTLLAFEYPFVHRIEFLEKILNNSKFFQQDQRLTDIEVNYKLTFVNSLSLMTTLVLLMFIHLFVLPMYKCYPDEDQNK